MYDPKCGHFCSHIIYSIGHSSLVDAVKACGIKIRAGDIKISRWENKRINGSHLHLGKQTWGLTQYATLWFKT